ncbi:MAG: hypothetical protein LQ348_000661 [Seirophora lacunosa]|nr:MAG: hypothetical protein LQ344_006960 [Seirophora lacunosa]KAI4207121.1 MAG: hypothetical protein LQ348_000661 [Seirophora lacunosa]
MNTPSPSSSSGPLRVVILGTCDTKLAELLYLRSQILSHASKASVTLIDVGGNPVSDPAISISHRDLLVKHGPSPAPDLSTLCVSQVMEIMTECATACLQSLHSTTAIHGVVALGGSSGTSLASAAMRRALPFLFPKFLVSTVASGNTAPFVGETDITLMYSIVDIAGSNYILDSVLDNAAAAVVGMAKAYRRRLPPHTAPEDSPDKSIKKLMRVAITMFGVTTPGVDAVRTHLTSLSVSPTHPYAYEVFVFHATGRGGLAMERLISAGALDAVIDLTTTEIADEIVGGIMSAGPDRLTAAAKAGLPQIVSLGACEIVNFGVRDTLPPKFEKGRNIYAHNTAVTIVRTNRDEARQIGGFISGHLMKNCTRPEVVEVVMPTKGLSVLSKPGGVYADEDADAVLFNAVERGLENSGIVVVRDGRDVNDEGFARDITERLVRLIEKGQGMEQRGQG